MNENLTPQRMLVVRAKLCGRSLSQVIMLMHIGARSSSSLHPLPSVLPLKRPYYKRNRRCDCRLIFGSQALTLILILRASHRHPGPGYFPTCNHTNPSPVLCLSIHHFNTAFALILYGLSSRSSHLSLMRHRQAFYFCPSRPSKPWKTSAE